MGTDIRQDMLDMAVKVANETIGPDVRLHYFGRDTESGSARVIRYTDEDAYGNLVAIGSPRECWQYLVGFVDALGLRASMDARLTASRREADAHAAWKADRAMVADMERDGLL